MLNDPTFSLAVILISFFSNVILAGYKDPVAMDGNIVNLDPRFARMTAAEVML